MCNLYNMRKNVDEVARLFRADPDPRGNAGENVYPGYPGLVVAEGRVRQMTWGFPLTLKGKNGQPLKPKPVNNCRTDKLDSFMWRYSFQDRRCLIPVSAFCEAEGEKGAKTRTWFSLPDQDLFAVAGIWRDTDEWGPAYSMVMTEACEHVQGIHDRMPAILPPSDWGDWLDGSPDTAGILCRPFEGLMTVERTQEPWVRR
ncbi:SOS response-associated peptidase [Sphingomonas alba]|uniref:Abasic site processing protein n=1 Tax=Sphingomonas alba TaxID=2908208 RepID=A0ABT0RPA2_9SPHN|nr:SOS response-associated peptidase family protein [Sphingomonas alba]MCL6684462.1 SOS response-associated peptidase [Sphingomonas alba]